MDARDVSTFSETTTTEQAEETASKLIAPDLPAVVQGDGRHLMSLLKAFLKESTRQINLANGFTAEEIDESSEGAVQTPRNFKLTFTRLGGEFTWDHIRDIANLAYYELRTDTDVGDSMGLLERTVDNSSTMLPVTAVGHVYLYAFNKDGEYSNPTELLYNKPRPDAPQNIAISSNTEGTLITFSEIPTNCMGACIYIDGKKYTAYDNIYQLEGELKGAEQIEVAFFDQFGEGERGILYLVLPDVTGFLVERNGPELDFYWDPVNVYNVKYVVKVCSELSWEQGTELFRTATNDKNRRLYPNRGDYYLMVKAYDEYGNYSKNAAYVYMTTETDMSRNIILEFDQQDTLYAGSKINMYYDPLFAGVKLEREFRRGEYMFEVNLDQEYKARNWLEYNPFTIQGDYGPMWVEGDETWDANSTTWSTVHDGMIWADCDFAWNDTDAVWLGTIGDIDSATVKQEIARFKGLGSTGLFSAKLNGTLATDSGEQPTVSAHASDFWSARWGSGLYIDPLTRLEYKLPNMPETFNLQFSFKKIDDLKDTIILGMTGENAFMVLGYDARLESFFLRGSDGREIVVNSIAASGLDYLTFCISQGKTQRNLFCHSYNKNTFEVGETKAGPIGVFTELFCYPKNLTSEA